MENIVKKTIASLAAVVVASLGALSVAPSASAAGAEEVQLDAHDVAIAPSYTVDGGLAFAEGFSGKSQYSITGGELREGGTGIIHLTNADGTKDIHVTDWEMRSYGGLMSFDFEGAAYFGVLEPAEFPGGYEGGFAGFGGEIEFEPIALSPNH